MHSCFSRPAAVVHDIGDQLTELDCKGRLRRLCTVATLKQHLPITKWLPRYTYVVRSHMSTFIIDKIRKASTLKTVAFIIALFSGLGFIRKY